MKLYCPSRACMPMLPWLVPHAAEHEAQYIDHQAKMPRQNALQTTPCEGIRMTQGARAIPKNEQVDAPPPRATGFVRQRNRRQKSSCNGGSCYSVTLWHAVGRPSRLLPPVAENSAALVCPFSAVPLVQVLDR